jgi:hypothetical protein
MHCKYYFICNWQRESKTWCKQDTGKTARNGEPEKCYIAMKQYWLIQKCQGLSELIKSRLTQRQVYEMLFHRQRAQKSERSPEGGCID